MPNAYFTYAIGLGKVGGKILKELRENGVETIREDINSIMVQIIDAHEERFITEAYQRGILRRDDDVLILSDPIIRRRYKEILQNYGKWIYEQYGEYVIRSRIEDIPPEQGANRYRIAGRLLAISGIREINEYIRFDLREKIEKTLKHEGYELGGLSVPMILNAGGGFGSGSFIDIANAIRFETSVRGFKNVKIIGVLNIPYGFKRAPPKEDAPRGIHIMNAQSAAAISELLYLKYLHLKRKGYHDELVDWVRREIGDEQYVLSIPFDYLIMSSFEKYEGESFEIYSKHDEELEDIIALLFYTVVPKNVFTRGIGGEQETPPIFAALDQINSMAESIIDSIINSIKSMGLLNELGITEDKLRVFLTPAITYAISGIKLVGVQKLRSTYKNYIKTIKQVEELSRLTNELNSRLDDLRKKLEELLGEKERINNFLNSIRKRRAPREHVEPPSDIAPLFERLKGDNDDIEQKIDKIKEILEGKVRDKDALRRLNELKDKLTSLRDDLEELQTGLSAFNTSIQNVLGITEISSREFKEATIDELTNKYNKAVSLKPVFEEYSRLINRIKVNLRDAKNYLENVRNYAEDKKGFFNKWKYVAEIAGELLEELDDISRSMADLTPILLNIVSIADSVIEGLKNIAKERISILDKNIEKLEEEIKKQEKILDEHRRRIDELEVMKEKIEKEYNKVISEFFAQNPLLNRDIIKVRLEELLKTGRGEEIIENLSFMKIYDLLDKNGRTELIEYIRDKLRSHYADEARVSFRPIPIDKLLSPGTRIEDYRYNIILYDESSENFFRKHIEDQLQGNFIKAKIKSNIPMIMSITLWPSIPIVLTNMFYKLIKDYKKYKDDIVHVLKIDEEFDNFRDELIKFAEIIHEKVLGTPPG